MSFQFQSIRLENKKVEKIFEVMLICTNMVAQTLYNISVHYCCNTSDTLSTLSNSELKNSLIKNTFGMLISLHIQQKCPEDTS